MPARNRIKEYVDDTYYHLYNRGVEKRLIFLDDQDYAVYLSYLKTYLEPKNEEALYEMMTGTHSSTLEKEKARKLLRLNNFFEEIDLIAFCLMPNHFHFLVHQKKANGIDVFMNSLSTRYTMYFNRKYKRVGALYQEVYKAVRMTTDEQLLYLTKYIHRNPHDLLATQGQALRGWRYSSYPVYLNLNQTSWVKKSIILNQFAQTGNNSYEEFVEDGSDEEDMIGLLSNIAISE